MGEMLFRDYILSLLISLLPSLAIATFMTKTMSLFLLKQDVEDIMMSLITIRDSARRIISQAKFYNSANFSNVEAGYRNRVWYWITIHDCCKEIQSQCESIRKCPCERFVLTKPSRLAMIRFSPTTVCPAGT